MRKLTRKLDCLGGKFGRLFCYSPESMSGGKTGWKLISPGSYRKKNHFVSSYSSRRRKESEKFVRGSGVAYINGKRLARLHWDNSPETFCTLSCVPDLRLCSLHRFHCVSSSPRVTREQRFPSTFNSNLGHYSQTTKALSLHSGARTSEWGIFPITPLSIWVSGKHRLADRAFRKARICGSRSPTLPCAGLSTI